MAVVYQVGTGTVNITASGISPFSTVWHDNRSQYLYTAADLNALGASGGPISSLAFNFTQLGSPTPTNVEMKIAQVPASTTTITSLLTTGFTTVYAAASLTPTIGWNTYTFGSPYVWDGVSNLVVEVCRDNASWSAGYGVAGTNWAIQRSYGYYDDGVVGCTMTTGNLATSSDVPNIQFDIAPGGACSGTPSPGNTTGPTIVLTNQPFTLGLQNPTPGSGVIYQWYVSTAGAGGPWTMTGSGASTLNTSMTQASWYYCDVTCAGNTTPSNVWAVALDPSIQIGSGSGTLAYFPIYTFYGYNYSQQIYTASEMAAAGASPGLITKLRFYMANNAGFGNWTDWVVYLGNTAQTELASTSGWIPVGSLTEVFNGTISDPATGTWMELNLTTPFVYDGTNLVVAVDENTPNYNSTSNWGSFTAAAPGSGFRGILYYDDGTNPDPTAPPTANYSNTTTRALIQMLIEPQDACTTPIPGNTVASNILPCAGANVNLSMDGSNINGDGMTYQWQRSADLAFTSPTDLGTLANQTVTQGSGETWYYRCLVSCDGDTPVGSTPVEVVTNPDACFCAAYCAANSYGGYSCIGSVNINTLSSTTTGCPTTVVLKPATTTLIKNTTYPLTVGIGDASASIVSVWFDWNNDLSFASDEWTQVYTSATTGSVNITVPATAYEGTIRMRVRSRGSGNINGATDGCNTGFGSGTTEDFCIAIAPQVACEGTPDPGNTTGPASALSGSNITLGLQNLVGSGVTYQWYMSNVSASGPWTPVGTSNPQYSTTLTSDSWYYCDVTCTNSSESGSSAVHFVQAIPALQVPFTGSNTNPCGNNIVLQDHGGSGDYANFADGYTVLEAGIDATISINGPYVGEGCCDHLYIYDGAGTGGTVLLDQVGSTTISYTGTPGQTLTVRFTSDVSAVFAGFDLNIAYTGVCYEPCAAMPDPGATTGPASPSCPGPAVLGLENAQLFEGITYQWQSADDEDFTINVANLGTNATQGITLASDSWFRCLVTCSNTSESVYSTPLFIDVEGTFAQCGNYCVPVTTSGCTDEDVIAKVEVSDNDDNVLFSNDPGPGNWCQSGNTEPLGYSNFTNDPLLTATLQAGASYTCTVWPGSWSEGYAAWIDYNDDGVFDNLTERIGDTGTGQAAGSGTDGVLGTPYPFPITLSCNPPLGEHRMRVRCMFATIGDNVTPCDANTFGETEDYIVTITAPDPCPAPHNLNAVVTQLTFSATLSWTAGCTETEWDVHVQAAGGSVPGGVPSNPGLTTTSLPTSGYSVGGYEFYVRAVCGEELTSSWSGPFTFYFIPDDCVNALEVPVLPYGSCPAGGTAGSTVGSTPSALATPSCMIAGLTDVFYTFNSGLNTSVQWELTLGTLATYGVQVLEGGCAGTEIYCSADVTSGNLPVIPNTEYLFRLLGVNDPIYQGTFSICISTPPAPGCAQAPQPADGGIVCEGEPVELSWAPPAYAGEYDVYIDDAFVATVGTNSYDAGVLSSGPHTWYVLPKNLTGSAEGCAVWNFSTGTGSCSCADFCIPEDQTGYGSLITHVVLEDIDNTTPAGTLDPAAITYSLQGATTSLTRNITYALTVEVDHALDGNGWSGGYTGAWFDWDASGVFETDEFYPVASIGYTGTINVQIPADAALGSVRMRVRSNATYAGGPSFGAGDACGVVLGQNFGEVEDYCVTIVPLLISTDPCAPIPLTCSEEIWGSTTGEINNIVAGACPFNGDASTGGVNYFSYTAAENGDVTFSTCGTAAFDTRISVFSGSCGDFTCMYGNDDAPGCPNGSSSVRLRAVLGETYLILVTGSGAAEGLYKISTFCEPYCSMTTDNDRCSNASTPTVWLQDDPMAAPSTETLMCSYQDAPTSCSGSTTVRGVWYTFSTGPNVTAYTLYLATNNEDPAYTSPALSFALYSGGCSGTGAATEVQCEPDGSGSTELTLAVNTTYHLLVYNTGGLSAGTFGMQLTRPSLYDGGITAIASPTELVCDNKLLPVVTLTNLGVAPFDRAEITSYIDGLEAGTYLWEGAPLAGGESVQVSLPALNTPSGLHDYTASVVTVNDVSDEQPANSAFTVDYDASGQSIQVVVALDNNPGHTSWVVYDGFFFPVGSGGPYTAGEANTAITTRLCLPTTYGNCYYFYLYDQAGDGIANGAWQLLDGTNKLVLTDNGVFTDQSPSTTPAYSGYFAHEFCLPLGPSPIQADECNVFNNYLNNKVYTTPVSGVVNYQFEFANPNAGFIRRISLPRNWVKFGEMVTNPLAYGVSYFCRARADQGAAGYLDDHFGAGCEMALAPSQPICTELISTPGSTYSCGVTRHFGGSDKVWAQPVPYATQYRFRFTGNSFDPDGPGPLAPNSGTATRIVTQASYTVLLNWYTYALVPGTTYSVTVEAMVGGVWSGLCGATCNVTISGSSLMPLAGSDALAAERAMENNATVSLWPNPASNGRVNLLLNGLGEGTHRVSVDLFDLSGKRLMAEQFGNDGDVFNTVLDLDESIAAGTYMVHITVDGQRHIERLNVTR